MAQIALHAHFYQPPRDDPWSGEIDVHPDAAPYRDWNQKVHAEAYRANAFARLPGESGDRLVNNFEKLSFNVGPTLLSWIERADPETYTRIIAADRGHFVRTGHGSALAQPYHHTILPLAPRRDARTQVRWGLSDFEYRFGHRPQGMWLPETAASEQTLAILIEEGVSFTILAPQQAGQWREIGGAWEDVADRAIDPRVPYRYLHGDGSRRLLTLLFYDGDISHAIAFDRATTSAQHLIDLFESKAAAGGAATLVHAATDGETYGHHHRFGDLGLAYALFVEAPARGLDVTTHARFAASVAPDHEAKLKRGAGTSWSCTHGVERWQDDCGCSTGGEAAWNQAWRRPLRRALEALREAADETFAELGRLVFADPWGRGTVTYGRWSARWIPTHSWPTKRRRGSRRARRRPH